jgi:adenine-specific DNA-methyltransferase
MNEDRKKFQELLRELFQFDCADLDFGIYRIMNQKRHLIEEFIEKDLLDAVGKELKKGALREQGDLADQLATLAARIREDIADDAIDADGKLAEAHAKTKLGKQYLDLQAKAAGATTSAELEAQVFNHLWAFFSRYYDNGDFLSTRRYSRREKYAIPYNGEEVYLHWANRDQYYIKTGENFTDYQWKAGDVTVLFKLVQAETEKDNVKSDTKRLFVPRLDEVAVDKKVVTLPFEYRGLTEQEGITFGKKSQQDAIIAAALESLPRRRALKDASAVLAAVMAEYRKTEKGESVSRLEHHLRRYTGKNTRDYFIHKDLEGFLTRELDFYLKNDVLALDDLAAGGVERAEGWFQLLEAIRAVGGKIIAFLAQIENFQKRIFEKRKFVTETNYCFTLDRVPKALWPQILKNKAQIEEWKRLYSIQDLKGYSDPLKPAFLEAWPSLMIDTRFFGNDAEFLDTLLAAQKDLEESMGGLLVHSENFQALNLLLPRFREQVKCIYIDPPYNTGKDGFPYKDSYRHSSWLAMACGRARLLRELMNGSAMLFWSLDTNENHRFAAMMEEQFGAANCLGNIVWRNARDNNPTQVAVEHEYVACFIRSSAGLAQPWKSPVSDAKEALLAFWAEKRRLRWDAKRIEKALRVFIKDNSEMLGEIERYRFVDDDGIYTGSESVHNPHPGGYVYEILHPVTRKPMRLPANGYRFPERTMRQDFMERDRLIYGPDEKRIVKIKLYLRDYVDSLRSVIDLDGRLGVYALRALFNAGEELFSNPKPVELVRRLIGFDPSNGVVCDLFAGSGTTVHAVMNLNRDDKGGRQYCLGDMGLCFDTVLKPRLLKIVFSRDWKDGKPVVASDGKSTGVSHAFKYIRLESYEDALGNIAFDGPQGDLKFDDYVLRYMLGFETRKSETLLNVEKLTAPFSYHLDIMESGERKTKAVDLPETFNYLLGLKAGSRKVHLRDGKQRYLVIQGTTNPHGEGGERKVCVIWRDVTGWKAADFRADAEFVKQEKLAAGADEVFVNADSVIPDARVLDPVFKERMFAPVVV